MWASLTVVNIAIDVYMELLGSLAGFWRWKNKGFIWLSSSEVVFIVQQSMSVLVLAGLQRIQAA